jgi:outer membrane protein TolC
MQKTDWMYSIMVSITLPFAPWSAERSTAKTEELRAANLGIEADREGMQREMAASLRTALSKYATNDSLARKYADEIVPLTTQAADAQTMAYENGLAPFSAVLDARRMELMKQDDYFMVLMERQMAAVELEMMVGELLE